MTWPRLIVLHYRGEPFYVRPDSIIRLEKGSEREGGSTFSIGTQFAQTCDETPQQLIELIERERVG